MCVQEYRQDEETAARTKTDVNLVNLREAVDNSHGRVISRHKMVSERLLWFASGPIPMKCRVGAEKFGIGSILDVAKPAKQIERQSIH